MDDIRVNKFLHSWLRVNSSKQLIILYKLIICKIMDDKTIIIYPFSIIIISNLLIIIVIIFVVAV